MNLHVQCRKGGTPVRCCVSLPGRVNTSNKRLKIGASFPGFYLTFLTPRLARLSLLTPCLTLARASQQILLPFLPYRRRVSSIQAASFHLQSGDGECLPATQLYLSVFTCPTASLNLPSDAGESLPARQPYRFHPASDLPFRLYLSDTASLDLPSDAGESLPARQLYLFEPVAQRGSPVRHGDLETSRTSTRASQTTTSPFLARRGLPAWHSDSKTSRTSGESLPVSQTYLFHYAAGKSLPNHAAGWLQGFRTT